METILDRIHRSSLELLASIGVRFHCPEILERLAMMGVGVAGDLVRFTEAQVMDCLSMAPEAFTLKARNPEKDVRIGGDSKCLAPAYGASLVVTPENRRRNATLADYLRIAKLVHSTPLLALNGGVLVQPEDAGGQLSSLLQVPWAQSLIGPGKVVGILMSAKEMLLDKHLTDVGVKLGSNYVIGGAMDLGECPEFDNLWTEGIRPAVPQAEYQQAEKDFVRMGTRFFDNYPNMGAMVLECTGFPPFARALQREIGIPVFSWGTLMDFAYSITVHRDYYGHV